MKASKRRQYAVIGDLHLNKLQSLIPDHLERQEKVLHAIIKDVHAHGLKNVVLLGDVFDTPRPPTKVMLSLLEFLHSYSDIEFTWLMGNHDRHSQNAAHIDIFARLAKLGYLSNLRIATAPKQDGNVSWLPYPHKIPFKGTDLVFAHIDRPGARYGNDYVVPGEKWNTQYHWIIGHIHRPQHLGTHTYYTGTPWQLSFGEAPDKHWGQVTAIGSGRNFELQYIMHPITPAYTLVTIPITKDKQFRKVSVRHNKHPDTWYKLKVVPGIRVPSTFIVDHPRCTLDMQESTVNMIDAMQTDASMTIDAAHIDPLDGLVEYLQAAGLSKSQIKWALKMVKSAWSASS